MQTINPTMPITTPMTDTVMVRRNIVTAFDARTLRFASRFTFVDATDRPVVIDTKTEKTIKLMDLLTELGYRYTGGYAQFGEFSIKVMSRLGYRVDPAVIAANASILGHTFGTVLPVSYLVDQIGLYEAVEEISKTGKKTKKKAKKTRMVNMAKARIMVTTWYIQGTAVVADTKKLGMTLYAYSPSIDKIKDLFGKKAIALKVVLIGQDLVIVDHKVTTVDEYRTVSGLRIKPWSQMTTYDIDTDTHEVPFVKIMLTLIRDGRINLTKFGITDVSTFVSNAFQFGLNTAFKTWMKALKKKNEVNPKIKANTDKLTEIADKPVTPRTIEIIEDVAVIICDDVRTKTTDDELVAIGASVPTNVFDLGIPTSFDTGSHYKG